MIKLSGVIITYNEERNIEKCMQSLQNVVDEIVVVDSFSTDKTREICEHYGARVIKQQFLGYIEQKNFALQQAENDYIVSLDGDESLSKKLQESILNLKKNWQYEGYYCNRFNNFCGQWIKHSDWYPEKKLRVFDRRKVSWAGINPHDQIKLHDSNKPTGHLKGDILHWNYQTYSEYNLKMEKFSSISAEAYYKLGRRATIFNIIFNPLWAFIKSYLLRLGFLDGMNGLVICKIKAQYTFLKYIKLMEIEKRKKAS